MLYSISDQLAQFLVYSSKPVINNFDQKEELHRRNFKKMDNEKFKEALKSTYCNDPNISLPLLLRTVNFYFCKYAPLTRITKKIKTHNESWLKKDILTSVSNKNRIYKKFFKAKYPNKRDSLHH